MQGRTAAAQNSKYVHWAGRRATIDQRQECILCMQQVLGSVPGLSSNKNKIGADGGKPVCDLCQAE